MREIIYIQAGNICNHSCFTYSADTEVLVKHDVSFREGVSPRVCPMFTLNCASQPRFRLRRAQRSFPGVVRRRVEH
ncbi:hypothetical protein BC827DRAFT_1184078 [Russula dissimulans]|nr:hypothetical protein BC827DRAFT_1184078 [Russula dissimulans]